MTNNALKNHREDEQVPKSLATNNNEEDSNHKAASASASSLHLVPAPAASINDASLSNTTENSNKRKAESSMSSFLSSMTFASSSFHRNGGGKNCDCDECGAGAGAAAAMRQRSPPAFIVPNAIQQALDNYKRQRPLQRTQERQLIQKEHLLVGVDQTMIMLSLWQWTLPTDATPLLEFGDSHRLIWVQRLGGLATAAAAAAASGDAVSVLKEIGTGVVGSQQEQQGRKQVDWKSGRVYFVPSRKGKAIGWVHEAAAAAAAAATSTSSLSSPPLSLTPVSGPVVLYIAKVPPRALEYTNRPEEECKIKEAVLASKETEKQDASRQESITDCASWSQMSVDVVRKMLRKQGEENKCDSYAVDFNDSEVFIQAIRREIPE